MELVFAMYLHISPLDMWEMPYYDIVYLYRAYEKLVTDSKEAADARQAVEDTSPPDIPEQQMPKIPDYGSLAKDMMANAKANIPKI